ncbi:MAG: 3-dehydroquinate synthase [Bacteroidales bacterium]|nr:3-dehydroquinate synthase [Bacteroidales bacterium]
MKNLEVKAESRLSNILIGEQLSNLAKYIDGKNCVIVTDSIVRDLYEKQFPQGVPIIEIGLGEKNKTLATIDLILSKLVELEADRTSYLVAIGGGIVTDIAGFAASIFMRGIRFGFVSSTLLSQVDASVGGKNGVNLQGYKNMVGVFNQPDFVICDIDMLRSLEQTQFRAGFAEIIKAGAIKDLELFEYCEQNANNALDFDKDVLLHMIYESVKIKANVVEADEREKGERRLLNFGHTFAHAIEKMTGMLHGEAVSIGMVLAAKVSEKLGLAENTSERIVNVLKQYQLPVVPNMDVGDLFEAMKQDKKREGNEIHLVLLDKIGNALTKKVTYNELEKIVDDLRSDFR